MIKLFVHTCFPVGSPLYTPYSLKKNKITMAATSGFAQLSADLIKLYVSGEGADVTFVFPVDETQPAKR